MSLKLYSKKCKKKIQAKSHFIENKIYQSIEIFDERKEPNVYVHILQITNSNRNPIIIIIINSNYIFIITN